MISHHIYQSGTCVCAIRCGMCCLLPSLSTVTETCTNTQGVEEDRDIHPWVPALALRKDSQMFP